MKIDGVNNQAPIQKLETTKKEVEIGKEKSKEDKINDQPAAVFEKSETKKTGHIYDKATIQKLKKESEQAHMQLIRIVEDLLKRQGKTLNLLKVDDLVEVDETARAEAEELIGPDGPLGVEAVSTRLVDFAIALSGGDKSKADSLRKAIDQGFKEAEKILGKLPDISKETYKLTMEKFDAYFKSED